jgi:molecular chaperone HscA
MAAGAAHIRVTFQVDADGLLNVSAMDKSTGVQAQIQVKPSYGLEDSEIAEMLKASMDNAEEDMQARMLKEQQVEADRVRENLQAALDTDGTALLEASEIQAIDAGLTKLNELAKGTDKDAIKAAIKQVDKLSETFAQKRMDQSIKSAFSGQSVDRI